jgi:hypothetical protein
MNPYKTLELEQTGKFMTKMQQEGCRWGNIEMPILFYGDDIEKLAKILAAREGNIDHNVKVWLSGRLKMGIDQIELYPGQIDTPLGNLKGFAEGSEEEIYERLKESFDPEKPSLQVRLYSNNPEQSIDFANGCTNDLDLEGINKASLFVPGVVIPLLDVRHDLMAYDEPIKRYDIYLNETLFRESLNGNPETWNLTASKGIALVNSALKKIMGKQLRP